MPRQVVDLRDVVQEFSTLFKAKSKKWQSTDKPVPTVADVVGDYMMNPFPIKIVLMTEKTHRIAYTDQEELIGIHGAGFRLLRRYYMVMQIEKRTQQDHVIPFNSDGYHATPIIFDSRLTTMKPAYGYNINEINLREIAAFVEALEEISNKYGEHKIKILKNPIEKAFGIIGLDVPYKEPSWVTQIKEGAKELNPGVSKDGVFYFGEELVSDTQLRKAVLYAKSQNKVFKYLYDNPTKTFFKTKKQTSVCLLTTDAHCRIAIKPAQTKELWIVDPWMQPSDMENETNLNEFKKLMESEESKEVGGPFKVTFMTREYKDQLDEGSCVFASLSRALWICKEGIDVATKHPLPFDYAVLAMRILRNRMTKPLMNVKEIEEDIKKDVNKGKKGKKAKLENNAVAKVEKTVKQQKDIMTYFEEDHIHNRHKSIDSDENYRRPRKAEHDSMDDAMMNAVQKRMQYKLACMKYPSTKLLVHQRKIIHFMKNSTQRGMLLFHGVGSGKTITSIAMARCLMNKNSKIVFIAPSSVAKQFEKEVKRLEGSELSPDRYIVTTHHKFIKKAADIITPNTILVVDEAHYFRGLQGKLTQQLLNAAKIAYKVVLMTATPVVNGTSDLVPLLGMLHGIDDITKLQGWVKSINGADGIQELQNLTKCKVSYYMVPMDVRNFPRVTEKYKTFRMSDDYYQKYVQIQEQDVKLELAEAVENNDRIKPKNMKAFYSGVRRAANRLEIPSEKFEWTVSHTADLVKKGKKVSIFTSFREVGTELLQQKLKDLGVDAVLVNGSMTPTQRQNAVNRYNSGDVQVLIFTMAGAEGMDLKNTHTLIVMEPWWNMSKMNQITGRVARYQSHISLPKKDQHVFIHYLVLKKPLRQSKIDPLHLSIDEILYRVAEEKEVENAKIYDRLRKASAEKCSLKDVF